ncbi:hypothetical protein [Paenibacillus macerans]|uniref:hypothetical protein n=1 Tax=Paenibacillus macerans TaxID=44252 RepID=UPI0020423D71|nr:hypothetical protein [Paenibacillus macerans]MCM3702092.1 hypothetical protein [Paenibacillus macerans]
MMDWIRGSSLIEYVGEERMVFDSPDFRMEKVDLNRIPQTMTALGQFFTVASLWVEPDTMVILPAEDEEMHNLVVDQLAVHFEKVRYLIRGDKVEEVNMQRLKKGSAELFGAADTGIFPVLKDLYREPRPTERQWSRKSLLYYTVETGRLQAYDASGTEDIKRFLQKAYFDRGESFVLQPLGWTFEEDLRESVALRFFAGFVPFLTLIVDGDTHEVLSLELSGDEVIHSVQLTGANLLVPRRHKNCLYFDLGQGLVYVVYLDGQPPVNSWQDLKKCVLFQLAEHEKFADFDHERAEQVPEGVSILLDQGSIPSLLDTVNRVLAE